MNLYELLDVSPSATTREIKKSYRRLLLSDGLSDEQFTVIEDAYATLGDMQFRQAYDEELKNAIVSPQVPTPVPVEPRDRLPFAVPVSSTDETMHSEEPLVPSLRPARKRPRQEANGNPLRTFISCVVAAAAAGPIAILVLRFGFDKDPFKLWELPPRTVMVQPPQNTFTPPVVTSPPIPVTKPATKTRSNIPSPSTPPNTSSNNAIDPISSDAQPKPTIGPLEVKQDTRMPVPADEELTQPRSSLEEFFKSDYYAAAAVADADAQNVAFLELAKKLFNEGKDVVTRDSKGAVNNEARVERYAWYTVALNIAVKSGDNELVGKISESLSFDYQITSYELSNQITRLRFENVLVYSQGNTPQFLDAWKLLFQAALTNLRISKDAGNKIAAVQQLDLMNKILEQLQPKFFLYPDDKKQLNTTLGQLHGECISNSEGLLQNLHFELALKVLHVAKRIAITGNGKSEEAEADKFIAEFARFPKMQRDFEAARLNVGQAANDPKNNSAQAIWRILILDEWTEGLSFLAKGDDPTLAAIAKDDNLATDAARERNAPLSFDDEEILAKQWRKLYNANDKDINRREISLRRTTFWYEQTFPDLTPLKRRETEQMLKDLANGNP
jgi:hypothetical protein